MTVRSETAIKLVCFDLGGVVVRICRSYAEGCRAAGIDVRHAPHDLDPFLDEWHGHIIAHQTGRMTGSDYALEVSRMLSGMYSPAEIERIHHAWLIGEYDGVAELIRELHTLGVETAALSNTNHEHWVVMQDWGSLQAMTHRFASHELGLAKPGEEIYRDIERRTGRAGREIIFFDDLEENVAAARAVGWRAEVIDHAQATAPQLRRALCAHAVAVKEA